MRNIKGLLEMTSSAWEMGLAKTWQMMTKGSREWVKIDKWLLFPSEMCNSLSCTESWWRCGMVMWYWRYILPYWYDSGIILPWWCDSLQCSDIGGTIWPPENLKSFVTVRLTWPGTEMGAGGGRRGRGSGKAFYKVTSAYAKLA